MLIETAARCGPPRLRGVTRGARDAPPQGMATITERSKQLFHDHAGARWLIPMMALLAVVIFGLLAMLVYPYVSA